MRNLIIPMLTLVMCGFIYGYKQNSSSLFSKLSISGPSMSQVLSGGMCVGETLFPSGDVGGNEIKFTMNVNMDQCKSYCGLQKSKSWAHSKSGECLCGNEFAVIKKNSDYKSGNCQGITKNIARK